MGAAFWARENRSNARWQPLARNHSGAARSAFHVRIIAKRRRGVFEPAPAGIAGRGHADFQRRAISDGHAHSARRRGDERTERLRIALAAAYGFEINRAQIEIEGERL